MDDFVRTKLTEWGFAEFIDIFQEEEVDRESLFCLEEEDIVHLIPKTGPRAKFKNRLENLKSQQMSVQEEQLEKSLPSSSASSETEQHVLKRKLDTLTKTDNPGKLKRQCDTVTRTFKDDCILLQVQDIMKGVCNRLDNHDTTTVTAFLRNKIHDLSTDKKELVGVFGRTGAGKSSLINAIVGEKDLLPSGSVTACTAVMIKVEANKSQKFEAEVEFMSKEDWQDELWTLKHLFENDEMKSDHENTGHCEEDKDYEEEYKDYIDKMTALYGDEWNDKSVENLMEVKYFKEIPEFLRSQRKIIKGDTAKELSEKVLKYTRTAEGNQSDESVFKQCFWPLVKCVTVRVPNNDLLQHVTIVDLPGNGDRNKSRDQMWKQIVSCCSVVWIVSDISRPASDSGGWEILKRACSLMGNGGECQHIYFICTKSDSVSDDRSDILKNNSKAKYLMRQEFNMCKEVKKQFNENSFDVFTVSSREFLKTEKQNKKLQDDETEIPKLRELLKNLNDQHDFTLNYVSGAYGILSLIQGAKKQNMEPNQSALRENLETVIECELLKLKNSMEVPYGVLEKCLCTGVEKSKDKCGEALHRKLNPRTKGGGRGFHKQLRCALKNKGILKTKRKQINLNTTISMNLTDSIDEEFRKMFPNDAKSGEFYESIHAFSLDTTRFHQQYKHFELLLTFLNTEEAKVKTKICEIIRNDKKIIYSCLTETVALTMQKCYTEAAEIRGRDSLDNMKRTVENHFNYMKEKMFDDAKNNMLSHLKKLMEKVQKNLSETLLESVELSFKSDNNSAPDFEKEFEEVKMYLNKLTGQNKEDKP